MVFCEYMMALSPAVGAPTMMTTGGGRGSTNPGWRTGSPLASVDLASRAHASGDAKKSAAVKLFPSDSAFAARRMSYISVDQFALVRDGFTVQFSVRVRKGTGAVDILKNYNQHC
jgi:hypothetical protein